MPHYCLNHIFGYCSGTPDFTGPPTHFKINTPKGTLAIESLRAQLCTKNHKTCEQYLTSSQLFNTLTSQSQGSQEPRDNIRKRKLKSQSHPSG